MTTLVDSCVLLDILTEDPTWFDWSAEALMAQANEGQLVIDAIVYAEISIGFSSIESLDSLLSADRFDYRPIPREAAFLAGKCFLKYRRRGGARTLPLPDFFIGAHAAVCGYSLLTRDARRFETYFPSVDLVAP
jgi:hypothetical protein